MLTDRAKRWLSTLDRKPAIATGEVREALLRKGVEPFDSWLSFHEQYAGYIEPIGHDRAIWGLMQSGGDFMPEREVVVDYDATDKRWYVCCADAHPSYEYELAETGDVLAGPAATFSIHVERCALRDWFCDRGDPPVVEFNVKSPEAVARIEAETERVDAASDKYFDYRVGESMLAIFEAEKRRWLEVLSR